MGGDTQALLLPNGPFLERTGGHWIFVFPDSDDAPARLGETGVSVPVADDIAGSFPIDYVT